MFEVGDKIAYPMHGAGTIVKIDEQEVLGKKKKYYYASLPYSKLNVMIPMDNSEKIGVRSIIDKDEIDKVLDVLGEESEPMPANWNRRERANKEKLQTGDIFIAAGVVRDLVRSDREKRLSTGERKILSNAKQIVESELVLSGGYSMKEADDLVESHI